MKHLRLPLFLLVFALVAIGCDSDGTDDTNNGPSGLTRGSLSIEITGAHTESADGTGTATSTNLSPGWGILLGAPDAMTSFFVIGSDVGDRPSNGTYPISFSSSSDLPAGTYSASLGINSELFIASSGTLTITASSESEVKGSFNFSAMSLLSNSNTVTVTGSFYSINVISTGGSDQ